MKKEGFAMKKKIFAVALAAALTMTAASLCGCGKEKNENDNISVSTATPSEATKDSVSTTATQGTTTATVSTSPTDASSKATNNSSAASENRASDSSNASNGSSDNRNSNVAVTSVSLSKSSISMYEGDSATFEVYIVPDNATDRQYNVVTNNGNASIDCNGSTVTVYGENRGNCEITVSSTNGKSAACSVTVNSRTSYSNGGSGNSGGNSGGNNGNSGNSGAITDDTMLTHAQICTAEVMDRVVAEVNSYFQAKGMTYDSSLNINNRGWFLSGTNYYQGDYNYNLTKIIRSEIDGFEGDFYGLFQSNPDLDESVKYHLSFHCYHERQSNGEYRIYFCYG